MKAEVKLRVIFGDYMVLQQQTEAAMPGFKEMKTEGSIVKLTFDNAKNGLTTFGQELKNFKVAGENKQFYPANIYYHQRINKN